jgi:hypothetical protein
MVKRLNITTMNRTERYSRLYAISRFRHHPANQFVFGSQADVRFEAARKRLLTIWWFLIRQYMENHHVQYHCKQRSKPLPELTIDFNATDNMHPVYQESLFLSDWPRHFWTGDGVITKPLGTWVILVFTINDWLHFWKRRDEFTSWTLNNFK